MGTFEQRYLTLKRQALSRYFGKLNEMQKRAVFQMNGPLLILAGAGSGKTTVLIRRIENMICFGNAWYSTAIPPGLSETHLEALQRYVNGESGDADLRNTPIAAEPVRPWNILAITFTNKAAGELRTRLEDKLGRDGQEVHASTFHSLCVRILRRDIEALGYARNFTIYDTDDSLRVIKEALRTVKLDEKMFVPKSILNAISRAKDAMQSPAAMLQAAKGDFRMEGISCVYDLYQQKLKAANALDFDDIIMLTVHLFQRHPDVLAYYQNRFKYIMVDEYQDTNHMQYLLISLLAGGHKNLCVVGDDDQSIYKFRGATIANILSFEEQFAGAQVIRLEQNYRSTQHILSAANQLIANNTSRKGKNLWTDAGDGEKIHILRLRSETEEARYIADQILNNVRDGKRYADHAILYRMNAQSNMLEKILARNAIPYRIIGGLRFYERKEIKDMVAYMSVLNNPSDTLRLLRIINEPKRGIGGSTLSTAEEIAAQLGIPLYEVIASAEQYEPLAKKSAPLNSFIAMMQELAAIAEEQPLDRLVDALLEKTNYGLMLRGMGFEGEGRLENIMELKSNLLKYSEESDEPTLAGFLEEIALYTDLDNYDADADAVVLMTVHSAKGLEFPQVFLAGMDDGIFPGRAVFHSPEDLEEERRLAYVAITRAKQKLTVTTVQSRMLYGQTSWGRPSRFLAELPRDAVEEEDQAARPTDQPGGNASRKKMPRERSSSSTSIGVGAGKATAAPASGGAFRPNERVSHKTFGKGTVLSVKPMAGDTLLEIAFDAVGTKKLMANFARLTRL